MKFSFNRQHIFLSSSYLKIISIILCCISLSDYLLAQSNSILKARVIDSGSGEPLQEALVIVKNTFLKTVTDKDGYFIIDVANNLPVHLKISYLAHIDKEVQLDQIQNNQIIALDPSSITAHEIVISASRISETILQSPSQIQKINARQIQTSPSFDYLDGINELPGVQISTNSIGFRAINVRGFDGAYNYRVPVLIDGVDNQSPGLNFPLGNLFGPQETDIEHIEVISGPASALYGANAFLGVVSMKTKNPFDFPGLQFRIQAGQQNLRSGELRWATHFSNSHNAFVQNRLGFKLTALWFYADEYRSSDSIKYGRVSAVQDVDNIVQQLQNSNDPATANLFKGINQYLSAFPQAKIGEQTITSPGYTESELSDGRSRNIKLGASVYYKLKPTVTLSYDYHYMKGDALFSTFTRIRLKNAVFNQHKIELTGDHFSFKSYATLENAGDTYGLDFTGSYLSKPYFYSYLNNYINTYFAQLAQSTGNLTMPPSLMAIASAQSAAILAGNSSWLKAGTSEFDSLTSKINANPHLNEGAKFQDQSSLLHSEGQYQFQLYSLDWLVGASLRNYFPHSNGTVFSDTLINRSDTLSNGEPRPGAARAKISSYEAGAFIQLVKKCMEEKLKISASVRLDKSQNYNAQYSPRISLVYSVNLQSFRISAQTAFRSPDQFDQYALIDFGFITRTGNLNGFKNVYTVESIMDFRNHFYKMPGSEDPSQLKRIDLSPVKPEYVKSVEIGYRNAFIKHTYIEFSASASVYDNFIGLRNCVILPGNAIAGQNIGYDPILTGDYKTYSIPSNAMEHTTILQASASMQYDFSSHYSVTTNYSYSIQSDANHISDPLVPPYNTPSHIFGIGFKAKKLWNRIGCNIFGKWLDSYTFTASILPYVLPSKRTLDVQLSCDLTEWHAFLKIGATNVFNETNNTDSPKVGRLFFASLYFDFH